MTHKITALSLQKRNRQRVNVYLDGEFAFGLARIVAAWLKVGQEISDEKINQLQIEDAREVAYQQALKFISYRPRAEAEVRQNLQKHDVSEENINHVVGRLKKSDLLNDEDFARIWVENRSEMRPRGRRALAYELRQRGVDKQTIGRALASVDEEELAYRAALKRARKLKDLEWEVFRQKMYRFLSQRGFNYEVSAHTISQVWEELSDTDNSSIEEVSYER